MATLGVLAVVYGGSTADGGKPSLQEVKLKTTATSIRPTAPLVGDLLTLVASIGYGLYQVLYKKYASLPSDPEILAERPYDQIPSDDSAIGSIDEVYAESNDAVNPLPFGLHANLLTSIIGLFTLAILWIPIPILHHLGIEPFMFPQNAKTVFTIAGIALSGVVFNAGFMVNIPVPTVTYCTDDSLTQDPSGGMGSHRYIRRQSSHHRVGLLLGCEFNFTSVCGAEIDFVSTR